MKNISSSPGLYLHIPFCDTKCGYCDFYSITNQSLRKDFVPALLKEIRHFNTKPFSSELYDTIYFGGGTPSLLDQNELKTIFLTLWDCYKFSTNCEITIEVNPGTIDFGKLQFYKEIGINRLSIGIQSFNNSELKILGRIHDSSQAVNTYNLARKAGFENISIDLIFALPGQELNKWIETLKKAVSLNPDHISAYNLIYEKGTPFYQNLLKGKFLKKDEEEELSFYNETLDTFTRSGYEQYEVSNYAKNGNKYSRHNYKYWNHTNYLSFGPSAHSYWNQKRWSNIRSLNKYIKNLFSNKSIIDYTEKLLKPTLIFENIMLSLRTTAGINLELFDELYNVSFLVMHENLNSDLLDNGLAKIDGTNFKLTQKGMIVCDEILSRYVSN